MNLKTFIQSMETTMIGSSFSSSVVADMVKSTSHFDLELEPESKNNKMFVIWVGRGYADGERYGDMNTYLWQGRDLHISVYFDINPNDRDSRLDTTINIDKIIQYWAKKSNWPSGVQVIRYVDDDFKVVHKGKGVVFDIIFSLLYNNNL